MERLSHFDLPGFLQSVILGDMNLSGKMVQGEEGHTWKSVLFDLPGFLQSVILGDMNLSGKIVQGGAHLEECMCLALQMAVEAFFAYSLNVGIFSDAV